MPTRRGLCLGFSDSGGNIFKLPISHYLALPEAGGFLGIERSLKAYSSL